MSSTKTCLVTVPIPEVRENNCFVLGEWCKLFKDRESWEKISHSMHEYHWEDPNKIEKDHKFLNDLYEDLLNQLYLNLNKFHKVSFSKRFWRIFIGPWLLTFVSTIWDRWEVVRTFFEQNNPQDFYFLKLNKNKLLPPNNFEDSISQIGNDYWNEYIFSEILQSYEIDCKVIDYLGHSDARNKKNKQSQQSLYKKFFKYISSINRRRELTIFQGYFPRLFSIILAIFLQKNTVLSIFFKEKPNNNVVAFDRNKLNGIELTQSSEFEKFLNKQILNFIPLSYIESFAELKNKATKIPASKSILTANAHFGNELFKIWAAINCESGSNLIISSHGGAIYPKFSVFDHQEAIADKRIIWGKQWMSQQITLPPNKLEFKVKKNNRNGVVSVIDNDSLRYSYRCMSASQGPLVLKSFKMTKSFLDQLEDLHINFKIKPKYSGHNETADRYEYFYGKNRLYKSKTSIKEIIKKSKLLVCTYPQTAYAECMYSGAPTLLVYDSDIWQTQSIYKELLVSLEKNKMLFTNEEEAVNHIKSIYDDPFSWWEKAEIVKVRKEFMDFCITNDKGKLSEWLKFLKSESR